ncbi:MAG: cobalt transporter [Leptolyngbyaceae bacterium]|nr:cobalt transporter [Leptolyngbyaceae bacterium]
MMKSNRLISPILLGILTLSAPTPLFAHVGHGDEFQATGGIQRVKVNAETDSMLGITVAPITQAAEAGIGVMIPVTALVDADGKQLVFVQYENFYEPVEVKTGATKGDLITVTDGLTVSETLVTQGSLSLYAESRKTKPTESASQPAASPKPVATAASPSASPQPKKVHAQADAQGIPHSHDNAGNMVPPAGAETPSSNNVWTRVVVILGSAGVLSVLAGLAIMGIRPKRKNTVSDNSGGN